MIASEALDSAIVRARAHSPFLARLLARRPEIVDDLAREGLAATLAATRAQGLADPRVGRSLRRERQAVALAVALADLAGAPFETVTAALTDFADRALDRAISAAIAERTPGEPVRGFVALALGKQGSRELNYSSDIDPILLFDPATLPHRPREEPAEAAARIARRVVALLQEPDADGYVLRVDLRLRPASEATPLAVPIGLATTHYESSALPWERAAFIRARAAAGDRALGDAFLDSIRAFVWRRALDYGAIRDMRALSRRIRDAQHGSLALGPGFDLKRGRGGIREIEFFAQIHQLIHGGRDPRLRAPATLDALAALGAAGLVPADDVDRLVAGYRLLRTIEHRLQMMDDRQTHRLPDDPAALDGVAALAGCRDGGALVALLQPHVETAASLYDGLEAGLGAGVVVADPDLAAFADPEAVRVRIARWRAGEARTTRSLAAREALEAVLPALVAAFSATPAPDAAIDRFDRLVGMLPSALNLFRLLEARPALIDQLAVLLSHAPVLADALTRRASLLDGLIGSDPADDRDEDALIAADLRRGERGDDYQALLDRVRVRVGEARFRLGARLITGQADPIAVGEGYARLAGAALDVLAQATVAEFERAHGRVPESELLILALGRLGGGVMTDASDLDLVYLFTGDFLAESDGPRPLGATTYYNRLAQRVTAALSVPTPSGPLYPVDTRLRPSGNQGLLAVSLDSFARYEEESAWTWEHMALVRARPIYGSAAGRAAAQAVIDRTLRRQRDPGRLGADARGMRATIATHKPPAGPLDVKLVAGGLVDAEFAVHLLQLGTQVGLSPRLHEAAVALAEAGLLAPGFDAAGRLLTAMLIVLRLVAPGGQEPAPASRPLVARACGQADWPALMAAYDAARDLVSGEWRRVAGLG